MRIEVEIIERNHKRASYVISPIIDALYKMIEETYLGYREITLENPIQEHTDNDVLGDFFDLYFGISKRN